MTQRHSLCLSAVDRELGQNLTSPLRPLEQPRGNPVLLLFPLGPRIPTPLLCLCLLELPSQLQRPGQTVY